MACIDLLISDHQIEVDHTDTAKTAYLSFRSLQVYNVMPYNLCNVHATFQQLIDQLIGTPIDLIIFLYIKNVLIYTKTPELLITIFSTLLERFAKAELKSKPSVRYIRNQ